MQAARNVYEVTITFKSTQEHARNVADALRMHLINLKLLLWVLFSNLTLKAIVISFLTEVKQSRAALFRWESCLIFRAGKAD